ncbi:helix-turn-helix transcriptional regulator [Parabacteroides merdae]|uniref:helix-turn-helix domain-containing protein n=1 Tax=Parabacteroides merdae TaxID=46503 RepID=UPI001E321096|nr:helix-turn-helix transcriptional regulator [Parabacteroides merdae]MDB9116739.1 helix-turn-helix transcriptional regulator [Parabacteroides merdae]
MNEVNEYKADGEALEYLDFYFCYDVTSFLSYYSKRLSLAGLERITGVSQGQLSHYMTGRRNPSHKTVERIQTALRSFGAELSTISLV